MMEGNLSQNMAAIIVMYRPPLVLCSSPCADLGKEGEAFVHVGRTCAPDQRLIGFVCACVELTTLSWAKSSCILSLYSSMYIVTL